MNATNPVDQTDPATFTADGIRWGPSTEPMDMVGVDYRTRHAYQATIDDVVYVLTSRSLNDERLGWWCGPRHLDVKIWLGAHRSAREVACGVAATLAEDPTYFLTESSPSRQQPDEMG